MSPQALGKGRHTVPSCLCKLNGGSISVDGHREGPGGPETNGVIKIFRSRKIQMITTRRKLVPRHASRMGVVDVGGGTQLPEYGIQIAITPFYFSN